MATKIIEPPHPYAPWDAKLADEDVYARSEADAYIRQLKRALWLARARAAYWQARTLEGIEYVSQAKKWYNVNKKCRAKAEEFLIKEIK